MYIFLRFPGRIRVMLFPFPFLKRDRAKRSRGERDPPGAGGGSSPSGRACPSPPPCLSREADAGCAAPQPHGPATVPRAAPAIRGLGQRERSAGTGRREPMGATHGNTGRRRRRSRGWTAGQENKDERGEILGWRIKAGEGGARRWAEG